MLEVRELNYSDWKKITELLKEVVLEDPPVALELEPLIMKTEQWVRSFPKSSKQGYFIVMQHNDKIVAFCYLVVPKFYKPIAYIGVVVTKKYRREDIGSQLFYNCAEWASGNHLQYLIADIWAWNKKSIKFFENLGFVEKELFLDNFKGEQKEKVRLVKKL
jgi:L-amino acid N-acyltransferase YncA